MRIAIIGCMVFNREISYLVSQSRHVIRVWWLRQGLHNTLKALYFDKTGFVLMQKRLDQGRFQWPQDPSQARELTRQELRWLLEGLSINQPKALKPSGKKDF